MKTDTNDADDKPAVTTMVIKQEWHIARARKTFRSIVTDFVLNSVDMAELETCLSELAYNLFFHTTHGGEIRVKFIDTQIKQGVHLHAVDSGPGIICLEEALKDGFSTNGGLGGGLPGVKRLMDDFSIESTQFGTSVSCVKWCC